MYSFPLFRDISCRFFPLLRNAKAYQFQAFIILLRIILSHIEGDLAEIAAPEEDSFVICADGGYGKALEAGIKPDIVIGDLDSSADTSIPDDIPLIRLQVEKDVTDTDSCLEYALEQGFSSIFIIGGLGGRCDHSIANIQNIVRYSAYNEDLGCAPRIIMADKYTISSR